MTLSDLAAMGSFISGVAVVISFVFLGLQMRQNTKAVKAAASQAHTNSFHELAAHLIDNSAFANIWRRGIERYDSLTDDERVSFVAFLSTLFRFFEASRLQWKHGQLDNEHWHNVESNIRAAAPIAGVQEYWKLRGAVSNHRPYRDRISGKKWSLDHGDRYRCPGSFSLRHR